MLSMRPPPHTHWPWLLWQHIEKQHWSTCGASTKLLPFLLFPASLYVSRFMGNSGLHILHLSSCQTSRNRRSHLRLLCTLIAYKMIMHILNMAWYSNMGLFYFSPAIKFSIFYHLCLESVFSQISVRFYSPQTMTGNHQHAATTANHLLNSTITPDEKQISGYDPKRFMSEQHSISSKHMLSY